ncbi:MAG: EamA family transporter [Pseudomonadota bacterium]
MHTEAVHPPASLADRVPPHAYFAGSAVFHYLGPSFAVLLFASVAPLGVAWLRIAIAGAIFGLWKRPWRVFARLGSRDRWLVVLLGLVLAAMNSVFYLAIAKLPLATVGAMEFVGPILLAAFGMRSRRNWLALAVTVAGLAGLVQVRLEGEPLGFVFGFANAALFAAYVAIGHRVASSASATSPVDRLAAAMAVATVFALPLGIGDALPAFHSPMLLLAAAGVAVSSSVVPYICDQLAMRRLPQASFALMLAILPAMATLIGYLVLGQRLSAVEIGGVLLVALGIAIHRPAAA